MIKNPYETLNIPKDADERAIENAYRKAAAAVHPDRGADADEERFQALSEAKSLLLDPTRRSIFDAIGYISGDVATDNAMTMILEAAVEIVGTNPLCDIVAQVGLSIRGKQQSISVLLARYRNAATEIETRWTGAATVKNMLLHNLETRILELEKMTHSFNKVFELLADARYTSRFNPNWKEG